MSFAKFDQCVTSHCRQHPGFINTGSLDIPLNEVSANPTSIIESHSSDNEPADIYFVCRLGNDSQIAVDAIRNAGVKGVVKDLVGGLRAWSLEVDGKFPVY